MPHSADTHPSDDTLELYSMSRLPESETETVEQHLLTCGECCDRLKDSDEYVASMRRALTEIAQDSEPVSDKSAANWFEKLSLAPKPLLVGTVAAVAVLLISVPALRSPGEAHIGRLEAWRGAGSSMNLTVPADRPLGLTADASGLPDAPSYAVRVVDYAGSEVAALDAARGGDEVAINLDSGLDAGQYWVRVYEFAADGVGRGELLREFGLRVE